MYLNQVKGQLPHAHFTHDEGQRRISPEKVAAALNSARVGLCLSAREGAMYAATEYLMCGLPVVSTSSLGGRDEWFDTRYVRVVRDHPRAVADAVRDLIALKLPPQWVRQQTLCKAWQHRRRFVDLVQSIFDREQVGRDFGREWYPRFTHKLVQWRDPDDLMRSLQKDSTPLSSRIT